MMPYVYCSDMSRWHIIVLIAIMAAVSLSSKFSWNFIERFEKWLYEREYPGNNSQKEVTIMQENVPEVPEKTETPQPNALFTLADRLRELRDEKGSFAAMLKEINGEIEDVEAQLAAEMLEAECPNFTRGGRQFIMTTTTRWSAETDCKDALYAALKEHGYEHLFSVNAQTLGSFVKEQVAETADESGETHIPDWLTGLVKSYDDVGITVKKSTNKSK